MFGFFQSEEKKMRQHAANWLEVADRVWHFRRDQLTATQSQSLQSAIGDLKQRLKEKADASRLKLDAEALERVLRDVGGRVYPTSSLTENVEFLLVAAIVILGIRAYFVQPFKIPTNSMWPSYYGMTHELFKTGDEPGVLRKAARLATLGASHYSVAAPADGEVLVPVFRNLRIAYAEVPGRSFYVFPSTKREYTFAVGGERVSLTVPVDFDFERVLEDAFKGSAASLQTALNAAAAKHRPETSTMIVRSAGRLVEERVYWIPLGKTVKRGEQIVSFDILTGDLLFVDRFSYNFVPPKVGSGFVFKTDNIHSSEMLDANKNQIQQYYIKRLVGLPGDQLEIRRPPLSFLDGQYPEHGSAGLLFRNDKPIEGAEAFGANARKEGLYSGYTNEGLLGVGKIMSVPPGSYVALGDNSHNSKDSRFWGYVPEKDVVGRPLFIYYPLTKRWGPAR